MSRKRPGPRQRASQRRALGAALQRQRCPSCNRLGLGLVGLPAVQCASCGWYGRADVKYDQMPVPGGWRMTAEIERLREATR